MSTSDAVAREAAWLATGNDSLPALLTSAGGLWQVVQGYWPGARFPANQSGIYVTRGTIDDLRASSQRYRPAYVFKLKLCWPVRGQGGNSPLAETEQQNFDNAIDLLIQRIRGPLGDKSHGGRFGSVGETPGRGPAVRVEYTDPEETLGPLKALRAICVYGADDYDVSG